jgi:hypothetical protein
MHYRIVHCIFRYLQSSVYLGLCYYGGPDANILQAYSNVNFTSDLFDKKSCNGFLVSMNGGPILWGSKRNWRSFINNQRRICGRQHATKEVVWTWYLLMDLGFQQPSPTKLLNDNQNNIQFIHNPEFNCWTKHIDISITSFVIIKHEEQSIFFMSIVMTRLQNLH